jgi:GAF domain-containing protein
MEAISDEPLGVSPADSETALFSEIALDLHEANGTESTIDRIIEHGRDALASDEAGVLLIHARGRIEVVASTSPEVTRAHLLQVEFDEGPCLAASEIPTMIFRVDDTTTDMRWPRWSAKVADMGFRSILAAPLATMTRRYGSLNMYARRPNAFDEGDEEIAMILARHASVALATSHKIEGLQNAVAARNSVGIAIGVLMARYDIESDRAFEVLRRYSQDHNVKLRTVAELVAAERGLPRAL